jgi:hypothetical protein
MTSGPNPSGSGSCRFVVLTHLVVERRRTAAPPLFARAQRRPLPATINIKSLSIWVSAPPVHSI